MRKSISIIWIFVYFLISCTRQQYSPEIESVLEQAGDNRSGLEQVLKHYSQNPADSLKLKAAEFLIINMPNKYSEYYDAPWNDIATVSLCWTSSSDKQKVLETYELGEPVIYEDVKYITSDYLINNVDLAFKVWYDQPWGKHISFDTFCEEILPYRVNSEPLENWREKALASFADINRSFQEQPNITSVEACSKVNNLLPRFRMDKDFPTMNYSQLMATTRGTCAEMCALAIFVMRALGIPVTREYTPKWPNRNIGHSWNAVCDSTGNHISFLGCESNPGINHEGIASKTGKIYRQTFAKQHLPKEENIPPYLQNSCFIDVSSEYAGFKDVEIPIHFQEADFSKQVYLAQIGSDLQWNIIGQGYKEEQNIRFPAIGQHILYMPVCYDNGILTPVHYPFMPIEDSLIFFKPDTNQMVTLSISEITFSGTWLTERMLSGIFQGANKRDFSDGIVLHTIKQLPENHFNAVKITNSKKFRYLRYVSPQQINALCNVAEIKFYGSTGELHGTPIGTPGVYYAHPETTYDKAFDGDPLTFFCADNNDSWTGLDLGRCEQIFEIYYLPRTEAGYGIYEGQTYELFYWNGKEWQSLGKKEATIHPLQYQAPSNALFYIKNITTPKQGINLFLIQNEKQKWL